MKRPIFKVSNLPLVYMTIYGYDFFQSSQTVSSGLRCITAVFVELLRQALHALQMKNQYHTLCEGEKMDSLVLGREEDKTSPLSAKIITGKQRPTRRNSGETLGNNPT